MNIKYLLEEVKLPAVYKREGKKCYYDVYRKKLIEITPEETVRQKVAALFETKFGVPREMISLEVPMSHYAKGVSGRADIVIYAQDEEKQMEFPLAIIECKNESVYLTEQVAEQAIRYCDVLCGAYIMITNGIDFLTAAYDEQTNSYMFFDEILSYSQMLREEYVLPAMNEEEIVRYTYEDLCNQEILSEYNDAGNWVFGKDTVPMLRSFAINFYQALLDTTHLLPQVKRRCFELIEDLGRRLADYGNAGGGHYVGIYRAFLVKDRKGEPQVVSISVFGTDPEFRGESRGSYTSLTVAIDRFKSCHNALQYNVDRFVKLRSDGSAIFMHNGQISGIKSSKVIEMVSQHGEGVVLEEDGIMLGSVDLQKVMCLDDKDVSDFVYNLIEYALLRDELRKNK